MIVGGSIKAGKLTRLLLAAPVALACLALWPAASQAFVGCNLSGGTLTLFATTDEDVLSIGRGGQAINVVAGGGDFGGPSILLACSGGAPTVSNTDLIRLDRSEVAGYRSTILDLSGGPFAPGATAETDGTSEIEVQMTMSGEAGLLSVVGTPGADNFDFGRSANGTLGANLNAAAEPSPDADLELAGPMFPVVSTRQGADVVRGQGAPGFSGPFNSALLVLSGDGNDLIAGGTGFNEILAGAGRDRAFGSVGRDAVLGGKGIDRITTGPRPDLVIAKDGDREKVNCGGGRDQAVLDLSDKGKSCKRVDPRRRIEFELPEKVELAFEESYYSFTP